MAQIATVVNSIKFVERILMGLVFVALQVRFIFHFEPGTFLFVFSMGLALVYFPFGFYFIGKPAENYSYTTTVILGFIYALGVIALLLSANNLDSYRYPLIAGFFVLAALVVYLILKLRSAAYPSTFLNAQFIRIGYIVLVNLIILL
jgi:hypothetical protein